MCVRGSSWHPVALSELRHAPELTLVSIKLAAHASSSTVPGPAMLRKVPRGLGEEVAVVVPVERPLRGCAPPCREQLPGLRQVLLQPGLPGQDPQETEVIET